MLLASKRHPCKAVITHAALGSVTLIRSARSRRISLSVNATGEARLTLPLKVDEGEALRFLEGKEEWVIAARAKIAQRLAAREANIGEPLTPEEIETMRHAAKEYLPGRTEMLARTINFKNVGRISVRATRTRWGSCSSANNISLSLFLMQLPNYLIDYVILHELTHTIHHDHSPRFHATLDKILSGHERELAREIKKYRIGYRTK